MSSERQNGYTIIEVLLFLSITGLLFLIAIFGTGSTIRTVRFSDSANSLKAYLQRQYDEILNGVNTRAGAESCAGGVVTTTSSQTPGTSNCLLIGKLITFQNGSATLATYNVIGSEPVGVSYAQTDQALIQAFQPRSVTNTGIATYTIPWGAYMFGSKRFGGDNQAVDTLLLIRSPKSSRIISYTFKRGSSVPNLLTSIVSTGANTGSAVNFCIKSADAGLPPAKIVVGNEANQSAIQIVFDANGGGNECNGL